MATQLFLLDADADTHLATDNLTLLSATSGWTAQALGLARGSGALASQAMATVAGPTAGIEIATLAGTKAQWISPPVSADVTIAGTITGNIWASENNMSANVSINIVVDVIRANVTGTRNSNTIVEIARTARTTTEVAVTTRAVNNFTVTPTSTVVNRGDRLRVRVFGEDGGSANMAATFTFNASYNGTTAAADGDSYVTFTENFSFESAPGGSVLYLTDTASDVVTASNDKEAWTSRGASFTNAAITTVAGWTAPVHLQRSGTVVDWFTKGLTAFTLTGMAVATIWPFESNAAANTSVRCEIARVANDGTSPTVWASWCMAPTGADNGEMAVSTAVARTINVSGDDLAVANGERLRLRFYAEDISSSAMGTGWVANVSYNEPTPAAWGDSYITLPQTVTEFVSAAFVAEPLKLEWKQAVGRASTW